MAKTFKKIKNFLKRNWKWIIIAIVVITLLILITSSQNLQSVIQGGASPKPFAGGSGSGASL